MANPRRIVISRGSMDPLSTVLSQPEPIVRQPRAVPPPQVAPSLPIPPLISPSELRYQGEYIGKEKGKLRRFFVDTLMGARLELLAPYPKLQDPLHPPEEKR